MPNTFKNSQKLQNMANVVTLPSTSQKKVVQCDPSNIIIILTVFFSGRKPWTLGYGMWLPIWRSWVQIPTLYGHFFKLICFKNLNVCLKMNENKLKRGLGWPVLKTVFFAVFPIRSRLSHAAIWTLGSSNKSTYA